MAIERKTIRISVPTNSATFEDDITAAIEAEAPTADEWTIEDSFPMEAARERFSIIFIMTKPA
jgi:hypothetical protein